MKKIILTFIFVIFSFPALAQNYYDKVNNSVVTVYSFSEVEDPIIFDSYLDQIFSAHHLNQYIKPNIKYQESIGTGFFIKSGYVFTNYHVIKDGKSFSIKTFDGNIVKATEVGHDKRADIAVLAVTCNSCSTLEFGDSSKVKIGDSVFAIGSPFNMPGTFTSGIISAKNRVGKAEVIRQFQISAAINHGNSGGPLFDINGDVIGMNTAIFSEGNSGNIGIGFSIPSNPLKIITDEIIKNGKYDHPALGVGLADYDDTADSILGPYGIYGSVVIEVIKGSAAENLLKEGDVITNITYHNISTYVTQTEDILETVYLDYDGSPIDFLIIRDGKAKEISLTPKFEKSNKGTR